MMTIEHDHNTWPSIDAPNGEIKSWDDFYYAVGFIPPNYPLPAIVCKAVILPQPAFSPVSIMFLRYWHSSKPNNPRFDFVAQI